MLINGASATWDNIITVNGDKGYEVILVCEDSRLKPYIEHAISEIERVSNSPYFGKKFHFTIIYGNNFDWLRMRDRAAIVKTTTLPTFIQLYAGLTSFVGPGSIVRINKDLWNYPCYWDWYFNMRDIETFRKQTVLHELMHCMGGYEDIKTGPVQDTIMDYRYKKDTLSSIDAAKLIGTYDFPEYVD